MQFRSLLTNPQTNQIRISPFSIQPFCDGTHRIKHYQITLKPFPFTAKEDKEYWFCNCKQSGNRPLCDGTHKEPFVQNAKSTIKY